MSGVTKIVVDGGLAISPPSGVGVVTIANSGVRTLNAPAGGGITVAQSGGGFDYLISNNGVKSLTVGGGLALSPPSGVGNLTIANSGVRSLTTTPDAGISLAQSGGGFDYAIGNSGVKKVLAGPGVSVTPSTGKGTVTIATTGIESIQGGAYINVGSGANPLVSLAPNIVVATASVGTELTSTTSFRSGPLLFKNSLAGVATLSSGSVVVSTSKGYDSMFLNGVVVLVNYGPGSTLTANTGNLYYTTPASSASSVTFTIKSSNALDNNQVSYVVLFY